MMVALPLCPLVKKTNCEAWETLEAAGGSFNLCKSTGESADKTIAKRLGDSVKLFITNPISLMIQPSLCANTVLALRNGRLLLVSFEGSKPHDVELTTSVDLLCNRSVA